jgi:hypothetical protein
MDYQMIEQPTGNVHRKAKIGVAVKQLQKRVITARMCIRQYLRKTANRLMSMNAEEQTDRGRHQVTSGAVLRTSICFKLRNLA